MFDVEVVRRPEKLYRNVTCDGCGTALKPVHQDSDVPDGTWSYLQADGALQLHLAGGYGMAIDPCGDGKESDFTQLFCKTCVKRLCEQWPSIARVVLEHGSSSLLHYCNKVRATVWQAAHECGCYRAGLPEPADKTLDTPSSTSSDGGGS